MISSFAFREDYSHGRPHRQTDLRCRHHHLGLRGRRRRRGIRHRRRHRCDRSSSCRRRGARHGADGRLGRSRVTGWWIHLPGRWNAVAEGVRVRGLGREHEDVHEGSARPRNRRYEDRRVLRGQRRSLQLARRRRGPVQGIVLGSARLGTAVRRRPHVLVEARTPRRSTPSSIPRPADTFRRCPRRTPARRAAATC